MQSSISRVTLPVRRQRLAHDTWDEPIGRSPSHALEHLNQALRRLLNEKEPMFRGDLAEVTLGAARRLRCPW